MKNYQNEHPFLKHAASGDRRGRKRYRDKFELFNDDMQNFWDDA